MVASDSPRCLYCRHRRCEGGKGYRASVHKDATTVDGVIDPVWDRADSVADFEQLTPYYGQTPSERTVAKLLATDIALYALVICYHANSPFQQIAGVHDEASGDGVSLMLDTFMDKRTAYKFAVSAAGVLYDARLVDDGRDRDNSWDGVWFGDVQAYPWGYVVEMEIPFKSIRYDGESKEWGLDFDRWVTSTREDLYWCKYEQAEGQRISKFGRLILNGAKPVVEGLNLEVYPVALAKADYVGNNAYHVEPDAGIDIFYNPSEQLTFQLTGNPDFAQIEADPYRLQHLTVRILLPGTAPVFHHRQRSVHGCRTRTQLGILPAT